MKPWRPSQVDHILQSESSTREFGFPKRVGLDLFGFLGQTRRGGFKLDVGRTRLGPQSTSLVLHAFHMHPTSFLIHVCISENVNEHTSWCNINSSNVAKIIVIYD